jgi:hypothetical protein
MWTILSVVLGIVALFIGIHDYIQTRKLSDVQKQFKGHVLGVYSVLATLAYYASDLQTATRHAATSPEVDKAFLRKASYCAARTEAVSTTQMQTLRAFAKHALGQELPTCGEARQSLESSAPEKDPP